MKQLGALVLLLPLDGMLVHHRVPSVEQLSPPGRNDSPSQDTQNEATRSITNPPWMEC